MSDFWKVDGKAIRAPSKFEVGIQDISSPETGRTRDAVMHKERVAEKITISVMWNLTTPEETAEILTAFRPVYVDIEFTNPQTNKMETKTFYTGDKKAPVKSWCVGRKRYTNVAFDIIER